MGLDGIGFLTSLDTILDRRKLLGLSSETTFTSSEFPLPVNLQDPLRPCQEAQSKKVVGEKEG